MGGYKGNELWQKRAKKGERRKKGNVLPNPHNYDDLGGARNLKGKRQRKRTLGRGEKGVFAPPLIKFPMGDTTIDASRIAELPQNQERERIIEQQWGPQSGGAERPRRTGQKHENSLEEGGRGGRKERRNSKSLLGSQIDNDGAPEGENRSKGKTKRHQGSMKEDGEGGVSDFRGGANQSSVGKKVKGRMRKRTKYMGGGLGGR